MRQAFDKLDFKRGVNLVVIIVLALTFSACGQRMKEAMGLVKRVPDEKLVTTSQPLAIPPDYSLRPPANAPQQPALAPAQANIPNRPQSLNPGQPATQRRVSAVPPGANRQPPLQPRRQPVITAPAPRQAQPARLSPAPISPAPQAQPAPKRKLTRAEADEERKRKKAEWLARKKAQNPHYGTWRNFGKSIFN